MNRQNQRVRFLALAGGMVAFGLFLAGCGSGSSSGSTTGGTTGGGGGAAGTTVTAALSEWAITLDKSSAPAGKVTFLADNKGEDVHEIVVLKTDIAHDKLPLNADGDVDEAAAGIENLGEIEDIASGKSGELTLDLGKGSYAIICNISMMEGGMIEHHYTLGMHTGFTVE